jgi:hypothetical protein
MLAVGALWAGDVAVGTAIANAGGGTNRKARRHTCGRPAGRPSTFGRSLGRLDDSWVTLSSLPVSAP